MASEKTENQPSLKGSEAVHQSEERYRLLVSNVRDYAIFLLDPNGIILTWNTGAENLKGYKPHEVIGQHFSKFYTQPDLDRNHPQHELEIAKETGRYEEEGWRIKKDGSTFWANIVITRLNDENGNHIGFAKITRDLTERKRAEEALRESEERFRLIVQSVKDYAIIMLDPEGKITSWNEGARRLKGWEANEIIGQHFSKFYDKHEIESGKCEYELEEAAATGQFEDEGWRQRKDGTKFWANVIITALRDAQGKLRGFSKVTRDMTERKRAEDKLKKAHDGLEKRVEERTKELHKAIESRDEFLSIASHELRTPLTVLKLQHQLFERQVTRAKDGLIPVDKAVEVSEMTIRQVNQLLRLVEDMLDVSRISTGRLKVHPEPGNMSDLVAAVYESFKAQFQASGIQADLNIEENLTANFDGQRMEQVIANLISNALKYGGGTPIEVTARKKGSFVEVAVSDKGKGIREEDQRRIFERFERAVNANEVSGLGLGLFISRQIADAHGGTIAVESQPFKGSKFIVRIPATNQ
jgi:PAS domain S-box-containing protein